LGCKESLSPIAYQFPRWGDGTEDTIFRAASCEDEISILIERTRKIVYGLLEYGG